MIATLPMTEDPLDHQLTFLIEIDALKSVMRQSVLANRSRHENSAEHSWHLAMFALVLSEADPMLDFTKIVSMLLIHDIVEIDAGDAPIHAIHDAGELAQAEEAAAERIFGLLPETQRNRFLSIWREFEASQTPDARFAKALDRLQPLLLNTLTGGGTWAANRVTEDQVYERYGPTIERGSPALWSRARILVRRHFAAAQD